MAPNPALNTDAPSAALRARRFLIKTRAKCAERKLTIASEYLLELENNDGEIFTFPVATTARLLDWINGFPQAPVYLLIARDEQTCLPDLIFEDVALH